MNEMDESKDPELYARYSAEEYSERHSKHENMLRSAQMLNAIGDWENAAKKYKEAYNDLLKLKDDYVWQVNLLPLP
jgi:hypothetical protein